MPNEREHTFREGSRVKSLFTHREGRISNPTFSPNGNPRWRVHFEQGTGIDPTMPSSAPAINEDALRLVHGPPEADVDALVRAARDCVKSGALTTDVVDRVVGIVRDCSLDVHVGDYVRERDTGLVYKVDRVHDYVYTLRDRTTTFGRFAATLRERFERVNVTPAEGVINHA